MVVLVVVVVGLDAVYPRIEHALTLGSVIGALILGLTPALLLMTLLWTIIIYARVELVLRRPTHEERLGRPCGFRSRHRVRGAASVAIAQVLLWAAAFVLVSLLYVWVGWGPAMLGTSGAVALATVRQGVALVRMGLKVALVGGQVELGATRPPPPRSQTTPAD